MNGTLAKPVPALSSQARGSRTGDSHRTSNQGIWDLAIGLAGLAYLGIVLFTDWTSPFFGITLILVAGYKLFAHHKTKRHGRRHLKSI